MRAMARCISVALLSVMVGSCAPQTTPRDRAHVLSEMADTAARQSEQCQSSGTALGSRAYKECRGLLENKVSIEKNAPANW